MDRRAPGSAAKARGLRAGRHGAIARPEHLIVHRPGARGVVWVETGADGPLICVAGDAPHVPRRVEDFLKREARRDLEAAVARHAANVKPAPHRVARHFQPLGLLLDDGGAQLLLAAHLCAALRARLSGGARGLAHRAHEPFADVLEADAKAVRGNRARRSVADARMARRCIDSEPPRRRRAPAAAPNQRRCVPHIRANAPAPRRRALASTAPSPSPPPAASPRRAGGWRRAPPSRRAAP